MKGLRVAGARTLEEANRYLEEEFLPWWNQHLVVAPANAADAHRRIGSEHDLAASLSHVITRQVDCNGCRADRLTRRGGARRTTAGSQIDGAFSRPLSAAGRMPEATQSGHPTATKTSEAMVRIPPSNALSSNFRGGAQLAPERRDQYIVAKHIAPVLDR